MTCELYMIAGPQNEHGEGYVKVGISSRAASRLRSLQTGSPFPLSVAMALTLPDRDTARKLESKVHRELKQWRCSGEWFHMNVTGAACEIESAAASFWVDDLERPSEWARNWLSSIGIAPDGIDDILLAEGIA